MMNAASQLFSIFKLRIGVVITLSALAGLAVAPLRVKGGLSTISNITLAPGGRAEIAVRGQYCHY